MREPALKPDTMLPVSPGRLTAKWTVARLMWGPPGVRDLDSDKISFHAARVAPCAQKHGRRSYNSRHNKEAPVKPFRLQVQHPLAGNDPGLRGCQFQVSGSAEFHDRSRGTPGM